MERNRLSLLDSRLLACSRSAGPDPALCLCRSHPPLFVPHLLPTLLCLPSAARRSPCRSLCLHSAADGDHTQTAQHTADHTNTAYSQRTDRYSCALLSADCPITSWPSDAAFPPPGSSHERWLLRLLIFPPVRPCLCCVCCARCHLASVLQEAAKELLSRSAAAAPLQSEDEGDGVWTMEEVATMSMDEESNRKRLPPSDVAVLLQWMEANGQALRLPPPPASFSAPPLPLGAPAFFALGAPPSVHPLSYQRAVIRWSIQQCKRQAEWRQSQADRSPAVTAAAGESERRIHKRTERLSSPLLFSPLPLSGCVRWPARRCKLSRRCGLVRLSNRDSV